MVCHIASIEIQNLKTLKAIQFPSMKVFSILICSYEGQKKKRKTDACNENKEQ